MCAGRCAEGGRRVRTPAPGPAERPRTRGQSGTRPGGVSLGGPGRPLERMRLPGGVSLRGPGRPGRRWRGGGGGASLTVGVGLGVEALAAAPVVAQQGHSPSRTPEPPLAASGSPRARPGPAGAQAAGFRERPAPPREPSRRFRPRRRSGDGKRQGKRRGPRRWGSAGRRGKRVARLADGAGRGGPRRWGSAARRGCGRDGKRRGKRPGEARGRGPAGGAPRRGAGTRGTDLASRKLGLRARPTSLAAAGCLSSAQPGDRPAPRRRRPAASFLFGLG